jgi:hypothetical protein
VTRRPSLANALHTCHRSTLENPRCSNTTRLSNTTPLGLNETQRPSTLMTLPILTRARYIRFDARASDSTHSRTVPGSSNGFPMSLQLHIRTLQKVSQRMPGWKGRLLNRAGRHTLVYFGPIFHSNLPFDHLAVGRLG